MPSPALATRQSVSTATATSCEAVGTSVGTLQLYEKTREVDHLKTQFFANISHELGRAEPRAVRPAGSSRYS